MYTLIPNPDNETRILLHPSNVTTADAAYVTIEKLDHDAIGSPQWLLVYDSRQVHLPSTYIAALIRFVRPSSLISESPTVLGVVHLDEGTRRLTVVPDVRRPGEMGRAPDEPTMVFYSLASESEGVDAAGAPRWNLRQNLQFGWREGDQWTARRDMIDPAHLIACLFPDH